MPHAALIQNLPRSSTRLNTTPATSAPALPTAAAKPWHMARIYGHEQRSKGGQGGDQVSAGRRAGGLHASEVRDGRRRARRTSQTAGEACVHARMRLPATTSAHLGGHNLGGQQPGGGVGAKLPPKAAEVIQKLQRFGWGM